MRPKLVGALLVIAALLAALAVAVEVRGSAPPTGSTAARGPAPVDYVALGDSFSAGPLVPDARADPAGCFRSTNNYPAYLAGYLGVRTYRDVTCSGARTRDLRRPQQLAFGQATPPQLDALSRGTDLVTLGIGGNDFGLFGSIVGTCAAQRDRDPDGAPCRQSFTRRIGGRQVDTKARDARRVKGHVLEAVRDVAASAPDAEIYVVGYPRLLPERGQCAAVPFATGDYAWGRRVSVLLNASLREAAEGAGATFVDLYPASRGHHACAGPRAWLNGSDTLFGLAAGFHPLQAGMRGMARAVDAAITGGAAPQGAGAEAEPPPGSVIRNSSPDSGD